MSDEQNDALLAKLESLQFTRSLLEAALESTKEENLDDSDRELASAVKHSFPNSSVAALDGPNYEQFAISALAKSQKTALDAALAIIQGKHKLSDKEKKFVEAVLEWLEMDLESLDTEEKKLQTCAAVLSAYQIWFNAFKAGLIHGWRAHELALFSSEEGEVVASLVDLSKMEPTRKCNVLGQESLCGEDGKHDCKYPVGHGGKHKCSECGHEYDNSEVTDVKDEALVS